MLRSAVIIMVSGALIAWGYFALATATSPDRSAVLLVQGGGGAGGGASGGIGSGGVPGGGAMGSGATGNMQSGRTGTGGSGTGHPNRPDSLQSGGSSGSPESGKEKPSDRR